MVFFLVLVVGGEAGSEILQFLKNHLYTATTTGNIALSGGLAVFPLLALNITPRGKYSYQMSRDDDFPALKPSSFVIPG